MDSYTVCYANRNFFESRDKAEKVKTSDKILLKGHTDINKDIREILFVAK